MKCRRLQEGHDAWEAKKAAQCSVLEHNPAVELQAPGASIPAKVVAPFSPTTTPAAAAVHSSNSSSASNGSGGGGDGGGAAIVVAKYTPQPKAGTVFCCGNVVGIGKGLPVSACAGACFGFGLI